MSDLSVFKQWAETNSAAQAKDEAAAHKKPVRMPAPGEEWTSHPTNTTPGTKPINYNGAYPTPD